MAQTQMAHKWRTQMAHKWRISPTTLVAAGSVWRYDDSGVDPGPSWVNPGFDDSAWASGAAELGYGDGDEATVVGFGGNPGAKHITTRFRREFEVSDPGVFNSFHLHLLRDDGAVVYVNGTEVLRSYLPAAPAVITASTLATKTLNVPEESSYLGAALPPGVFVAGTNTLAVEIHQRTASSSDISFDLSLEASDGKFIYFVWDAEWSMSEGQEDPVKLREGQFDALPGAHPPPYLGGGAAIPYDRMLDNPRFQAAFQARAALHFGAGGVLGPVAAGTNPASDLWQDIADEFDLLAHAESARWGDAGDPNLDRRYGPETVNDTWLSNIAYRRDTWIPQRRIHFLQALYDFNLALPANHPDVPPLP